MRELFESTIERLLGDLATSEYVLGCEGGTWPAELWAAVEESGFTLAAIPEPLGGADAGWSDLYVLARAAGRFAAPIPLGEALLGNWLLGQVGLEGTAVFSALPPMLVSACAVARWKGSYMTSPGVGIARPW